MSFSYINTLPCSHQWEYKTEKADGWLTTTQKCTLCDEKHRKRVRVADGSQKPLKPRKTTARKAIRKVSERQAKINTQYAKLRKQFLAENPRCQVNLLHWDGIHLSNAQCHSTATECHHKGGRAGNRMLDTSLFLACCSEHHRWIHDHPKEATELGLLVPRLK